MNFQWDGSVNIVSLIEFGALFYGMMKIYGQLVETKFKVDVMWQKFVGTMPHQPMKDKES